MKKGLVFLITAAGLSACSPQPTSGERGVGFSDYAVFEIERARREAALSSPRESIVPSPFDTASNQTAIVPTTTTGGIGTNELAAAGIGQTTTSVDSVRSAGLDATPSNLAPTIASNPGISDEQSFDAVTGRETIASDAERRAAQAAAREQVVPTDVPQRPSSTGPNIVEYAISAPNTLGQEWYSRSVLAGQNRFQRNCAEYDSADDAQRDFLSRGGPERDRLGIDPDGDGFACAWDPTPYQAAARN